VGVSFRTDSDTEVLLQSYFRYGEDCVERFEGMWSFAVYDARNRKLFLSRDRFAEKPMYYHVTQEGVYFASEVKFLRELSGSKFPVNTRHILRYLVNGYRSLYKYEDTFFESVKELPYACNMTIDPDLKLNISRYWTPKWIPREMSMIEAIDDFRECLLRSIEIRLRADVPLAFCLSGGIDSATVASIAAKVFIYDIATFSIIDEDERYNEYDNIQSTISRSRLSAHPSSNTTRRIFSEPIECPHPITQIRPISTIPY
jgi:Asparagine synthase (glutamine-hydrolyzing)